MLLARCWPSLLSSGKILCLLLWQPLLLAIRLLLLLLLLLLCLLERLGWLHGRKGALGLGVGLPGASALLMARWGP